MADQSSSTSNILDNDIPMVRQVFQVLKDTLIKNTSQQI